MGMPPPLIADAEDALAGRAVGACFSTLDLALVRAAAGRDPLVPRLDGDSQDEPAVQGFRQEPDSYGANLPLLFSDRDFLPSVAHLGLEAA